MQQVVWSENSFEDLKTYSREGETVQLLTVQQVIHSEDYFEETLANSQWRETAQLHTLQLFMQPGLRSKKAYHEAHWGKSTPLQ